MSKDLELFKNIKNALAEKYELSVDAYENLIHIEKSLKALEIIKEKNVDIIYLRFECNCLENYNESTSFELDDYEKLTQEEFDLLKEVLL